jgi:hypothetical protein
MALGGSIMSCLRLQHNLMAAKTSGLFRARCQWSHFSPPFCPLLNATNVNAQSNLRKTTVPGHPFSMLLQQRRSASAAACRRLAYFVLRSVVRAVEVAGCRSALCMWRTGAISLWSSSVETLFAFFPQKRILCLCLLPLPFTCRACHLSFSL